MGEQRSSAVVPSQHAAIPFWRDIRFIQVFLQIAFLIAVVVGGYILIHNLVTNLENSRLAIDFQILERPFGTQISEGQMDFDPGNSSNFQALMAGFQNTLRVVLIGLAGATVLGILMGVGRLSTNLLVRYATISYIELFRNTPLLVQLYFIYRGLRMTMPERMQDSYQAARPDLYQPARGQFPEGRRHRYR